MLYPAITGTKNERVSGPPAPANWHHSRTSVKFVKLPAPVVNVASRVIHSVLVCVKLAASSLTTASRAEYGGMSALPSVL